MRRTLGLVLDVLASAAVLAVFACGGSDLVLPNDGGVAAIAVVRGAGQSGTVGSPLADSIIVRVTGEVGQPVAGRSVEFAVPPGVSGGEVTPGTAVTGADGRAGAEWVLGERAGSQSVDARVVGADQITVRLTASARAGAAQAIAGVSGDGQSAPVRTALPAPLVVRVTDEFGNPVSGAPVEWSADPGTITPRSVETDADGRAAALRVLGASAGAQTATASSPQLDGSPVIFTQTGMPGSADRLVPISGDDQSAEPGTELPDPLVVRLLDQDGNGMGDRAVTWIVGVGGGSTAPTTTETDAEGFASARWTLGPSAGSNTLNAVVSGVAVVTFTATGTGGGGGGGDPGADHLVFQVQPSDARKKERIEPPVAVAVVDRDGNVVTEPNFKIELELASGSGKLEGKVEKDTKEGVAVFDDLKVNEPGDGKVLRASARDHAELGTVESNPFGVEDH
jgi:Big-like domain-containing protein